jgi:hypothetical protein
MTTITLPPEIELPLVAAAQQQGISPERLALESLRRIFVPAATAEVPESTKTLADLLAPYIGMVEGSSEAYSENCGERFTAGLLEKHNRNSI